MRYLTIPLSLLAISVCAQDNAVTNLKAPQSPASSIIGLQPSSINRPKSWNALEGALFSNFSNGGSFAVPNDFALEFSPFWAGDKKKVSIQRFIAPSFVQSLCQSFSISLASTQAFNLNDSLKTNAIGFGLRTVLIGGKASQAKIMALYRTTMDLAALSQRLYKLADESLNDAQRKASLTPAIIDGLKQTWSNDPKVIKSAGTVPVNIVVDDLLDKLKAWLVANPSAKIDDLSHEIDVRTGLDARVTDLSKLREDPRGFRLEFAASTMLNFPTNETEYSFIPKAGIWITPSYQASSWGSFEMLGVLRYLWYKSDYFRIYDPGFSSFDSNFDAGLRLVFKREKFSIEGEVVNRWAQVTLSETFDETTGQTTTVSKTEVDLQYLLNANYQIKENLALSYSFGKQLDPQLNLNIGGDIVSLLTLNIGFGAPKITDAGIVR